MVRKNLIFSELSQLSVTDQLKTEVLTGVGDVWRCGELSSRSLTENLASCLSHPLSSLCFQVYHLSSNMVMRSPQHVLRLQGLGLQWTQCLQMCYQRHDGVPSPSRPSSLQGARAASAASLHDVCTTGGPPTAESAGNSRVTSKKADVFFQANPQLASLLLYL